jgi:Flp pilus assembly pilin Flp
MGNIARGIVARLLRQKRAQALAEYALLIGLIAIAAITALQLLGDTISGSLYESANVLQNAVENASPL